MSSSPAVPDVSHAFLDVGNVIIHDWPMDALYLWYVYGDLRRLGVPLTTETFFAKQTASCRQDEALIGTSAWLTDPGDFQQISDACWRRVRSSWSDLCVPVAGAIDAVRRMQACGYKLAILANQPVETEDLLRHLGLAHCFEAVFLDGAAPYSKPDRRFFQLALDTLQVEPSDVLMIGDRVDNDIAPALALGFHAALVTYRLEMHPLTLVPDYWLAAYRDTFGARGRHTAPDAVTRNEIAKTAIIGSSLADIASRLAAHHPRAFGQTRRSES